MISPAAEHLVALPGDWGVARVKHLFSERDLRSLTGNEQLFSLSKTRGLLPRSEVTDKIERADSLEGYKRFLPGDLVMNKMQAWNGVFGFAASADGIVSPDYSVFRVIADIDPRFYTYLFKTDLYAGVFAQLARGMGTAFLRLNTTEFGSVDVPLPSKLAQTRIATFLDEQTARIDALIAEKEGLLGKLAELRLSETHAVLSGSLSSTERKVVTGDTWFPTLPEHWAFCPLNYRYEVQLGKMLDEKRIVGSHLLPYLRNTDVQWDSINVEFLPMMDVLDGEKDRYTVRKGDLLVCEGGDVGRAAIWEGEDGMVAYQKALHRVRPRADSDVPRYMFFALFDSAKRGRFEGREKATIAHLTAESFRRYRFPFPPSEEQAAIVAHLNSFFARLGDLEEHTNNHISRLREYRSSLISAAVTGQLDIDSYAAPTEEAVA